MHENATGYIITILIGVSFLGLSAIESLRWDLFNRNLPLPPWVGRLFLGLSGVLLIVSGVWLLLVEK